MRNGTVSICNI